MRITDSFSIDVPSEPGTVADLLRSRTAPPSGVSDYVFASLETTLDASGLSDRYEGDVNDTSFRLTRLSASRFFLEPVIRGRIHSLQPGRTRITLTIAPAPIAFLLLGLVTATFACFAYFNYANPDERSVLLLGFPAILSVWLVLFLGAHIQAKRIKHFIDQRFPDRHTSPLVR